MKPEKRADFPYTAVISLRALIVAGLLFCADTGLAAQLLPGDWPTNTPLASWSFNDSTNWTSDQHYAPISFTNLTYSYLGDFFSLVVDSTNPAWLQYYVYEPIYDGATNLTVDVGSVTLWFAPDWSSADDTNGGFGPQEYGRLLEAGSYTTNSSYGWWSLYVDSGGTNLYFSAQTNNGLGDTYTISAPIDWTTNYFHFVVLTYSSTNVSLYLDGQLATNDPGGLSIWPGSNVLSNGFYIGSDSTGVYQAHGLFNSVYTYNYPLDSNTVQQLYPYEDYFGMYMMNPFNTAMFILTNAISSPSLTNGFDVISGLGNLQLIASGVPGCVDGMSAVWFTNVTARTTNGGTSLSFTIRGGQPGYYYDVFATGALQNPITNSAWVWLGQGQACSTYTVNITSANAFLILGTPQDTSGFGLTDAYESLVAKVSPDGPQTDSYGVPYAWYAANGLVPITNGLAIQDPDQDGLLNYQEYQYGTRPLVSEGFTVWVSTPNGTTSIP